MLSALNLKTLKANNEINHNLQSVVSDTAHLGNGSAIRTALNAFIGSSNMLKTKEIKIDHYSHLNEKNIAHQKPTSPKEVEAKKKIPKIDLFKYPFNNFVETNCK
jgi:hypothetical protein